MESYLKLKSHLEKNQYVWLITGVAGFIGSNLLEELLKLNQRVVGIDNFLTEHKQNLLEVQNNTPKHQWDNFELVEGDICDLELCFLKLLMVLNYVLHQAALGSVPRSILDYIITNEVNIGGFLIFYKHQKITM